jgi:hypothetical protein
VQLGPTDRGPARRPNRVLLIATSGAHLWKTVPFGPGTESENLLLTGGLLDQQLEQLDREPGRGEYEKH